MRAVLSPLPATCPQELGIRETQPSLTEFSSVSSRRPHQPLAPMFNQGLDLGLQPSQQAAEGSGERRHSARRRCRLRQHRQAFGGNSSSPTSPPSDARRACAHPTTRARRVAPHASPPSPVGRLLCLGSAAELSQRCCRPCQAHRARRLGAALRAHRACDSAGASGRPWCARCLQWRSQRRPAAWRAPSAEDPIRCALQGPPLLGDDRGGRRVLRPAGENQPPPPSAWPSPSLVVTRSSYACRRSARGACT